MIRRDFLASLDAATKTVAAIGLVLGLYVLGHAAAHLITYMGGALFAAANGAH